MFSNFVPIATLQEGILFYSFYFAVVETGAFRNKVTFRLEVTLRWRGCDFCPGELRGTEGYLLVEVTFGKSLDKGLAWQQAGRGGEVRREEKMSREEETM